MEGMKYFLIVTNYDGNTEFAGFWADDEDHALEQLDLCCDEYNPSQYVTHIFVSDTEIVNTSSQRLWATDQVKDRIHDEHCARLDDEFRANLKVGDEVWWNDPDNGISSGYYTITGIHTESGVIEYANDIVFISNGTTQAEVFAHELE